MTRIALLALALCLAAPARAREIAGVTPVDTVQVAGKTLQLNGAGLRIRYSFFKVYVIALYLEHPTHSADAVIRANEMRRVELHILRALDAKEIGDAIGEAFERNSAAQMPQLRDRLERLKALFPAVEVGDLITLSCMPGQGTVIAAKGKDLGTIPGDDFAAALLSVWLGPSPVDETLKAALLGSQ